MAKGINAKTIAIALVAAWAYSSFGVSAAVEDFAPGAVTGIVNIKPDGTCPAGWVKVGTRCVRL